MAVEHPTEIRTAGKFAITFYAMLMTVAAGSMFPLLPEIAAEYGRLGAGGGVVIDTAMTVWGLGMIVGAPVGGAAADRWGRRWTIVCAVFATGIAGLLPLVDHAISTLIISRFVVGVALGAMTSAIIAAIGDAWEGRQRDRWLGAITVIGTITNLAVLPAAGLAAHVGWRDIFYLYLLAIPALFVAWAGFRDGRVVALERNTLPIWDRNALQAIVLGLVAGTIANGTALYAAFRFRETGLHDAFQVALYSLPSVVGTMIGAGSYARLRRRASIDDLLVLAPLICATGLCVLASASIPATAAAGLAVESVGIGLILPNLAAYAIRLARPEHRAAMVGLMNGSLFGAPFLAQFALAALAQMGGSSLAILGIAGCAVVLALSMACLLLRRC